MNLNEECLLQFLKNDAPSPALRAKNEQDLLDLPSGGFLTRNFRRILRHDRYVSFPAAILVRRPENRLK